VILDRAARQAKIWRKHQVFCSTNSDGWAGVQKLAFSRFVGYGDVLD